MKSTDAESELRRRLPPTDDLSPRLALETMLAFYADVRVADVSVNDGGDMLLAERGTYDWGDGEHFTFDITRQFITGPGEDEDIWQLRISLKYQPDDDLRSLAAENRWCHSPEQLHDFRAFVINHDVLGAIADRRPLDVGVRYGAAG